MRKERKVTHAARAVASILSRGGQSRGTDLTELKIQMKPNKHGHVQRDPQIDPTPDPTHLQQHVISITQHTVHADLFVWSR